MTDMKPAVFVFVLGLFTLYWSGSCLGGETAKEVATEPVQAEIVLTVSEGKRLIAKAVACMPIVKDALEKGTVIVTKGTTNTYVAEELLGRKIPHGAFLYGRVYPEKGGKRLEDADSMTEVVLVKGVPKEDLPLEEAVKMLRPGDVVLKGGNVLDYPNKTVGVIIRSPTGGTTGTIMPYAVARKANLVIPIGLEKQVAGAAVDIASRMREPLESLNRVSSMFLITGTIVTELEALNILAGVSAFQVGAGGIGGAEGSVRLLVRGEKARVEKALEIVGQVQGEPPFVE